MSTRRILVGGTIALDNVKTPKSEGKNLLGGSASFASLAASIFSDHVELIGIIGQDFPENHLSMLRDHKIGTQGVEVSDGNSFCWDGEYFDNMNQRVTHQVALNVLENWRPSIPSELADASIIVLANMAPDNQLEMLEQCASAELVIADTMDLWIEIANDRLHEILSKVHIFVLNESEARELTGTKNLLEAGRILREKGPNHVVIKLGEFGAFLFGEEEGWHMGTFRCSAYPIHHLADPTGAGDSFLGAMAGYLSTLPDLSALSFQDLRQAVVYGSIAASFTCESFSTRHLEKVDRSELEGRAERLRAIVSW